MTILYCDCFSGISGDMFLGALLDAGLPVEYLADQFGGLNLPEFKGVLIERVRRGVLAATLLRLDIHEPVDEPAQGDHPALRRLGDITNLIKKSSLPEPVQQTSLKIFQNLAEAEARVHDLPVEEVHFHEIGGIDSILDIVGAAIGVHYFGIENVYASALPLGSGQVETRHGKLPLPAPATLELLRIAQAPLVASSSNEELVTPTGAAILSTLAKFSQPELRLQRVGIGAGQKNFAWPNILRLLIGVQDGSFDSHVEIETNIDDMNPQIYAPVMAKLFKAGALDVFFTPIFMKKNRPATRLSVIASREDEARLCDILLRETSTLGVRVKSVWRHEAQREMRVIPTPYGEIPVKVKMMDGQAIQVMPEFDICLRAAEASHVPVSQVIQAATALSLGLLQKKDESGSRSQRAYHPKE